MAYCEMIADKLNAAGWSWGMTTAIDGHACTLFVVDDHRNDGRRLIVRSDELLVTAFFKLRTPFHATGPI
jgi:hypothetical protein